EDGDRFIDSETLGLAPCTFISDQAHALLHGLRRCRGITVNTVHASERTIDEVIKLLAPDTVSMEGAAVFHAAQHFGTPCIQVRAISNYVERRNKANWQLPLAIENLNRWLAAFTRLH